MSRFGFAFVLVAGSVIAFAQSPKLPAAPSGDGKFEVVSIKPNNSGSRGTRIGVRGRQFLAENMTALGLVTNAYRHETFRIVGAPDWMSSERYDLTATADVELNANFQGMLKTVLAERFKLMAHTDTRTLQTYALVLAARDGKLGPQLRHWTVDCETRRANPSPTPTGAGQTTVPTCGMRAGPGLYAAGGVSLATFAGSLASDLNAVVRNQTGLDGDFEISLRWNPDAAAGDPALPSLFTALQEQLGLKLEPTRAPVEVLVIDSVERPTPD